MDQDLQKLCNKIKEMRVEHKVTQKQLAEALNISVTNMCNIEKGKTVVTIQNLIKMKNFFGCEMKDFFIYEEEDNSVSDKNAVSEEENPVPAGEFLSSTNEVAEDKPVETEKNKLPDSIDLQDAINLLRLLRRIDIKGL